MAYYKSEMDRRGFFKKAFALGAVALVPHSIFTEVENDPSFVQEKVTVKELNFGDYRAVLVRDGAVIAKSHLVNVSMERAMIKLPPNNSDGYTEYIPGLMSFDIEMNNVSSDTKKDLLLDVLKESEKLEVYIRPAFDDQRYYAECYLVEVGATINVNEVILYDIRLQGSGALIIE